MAWLDFIKAIRQNSEEEKRRDREGGVKNRIFSFLDDTLDTGQAVGNWGIERGKDVVGAAAGLGREVVVKPIANIAISGEENAHDSSKAAQLDFINKLKAVKPEERADWIKQNDPTLRSYMTQLSEEDQKKFWENQKKTDGKYSGIDDGKFKFEDILNTNLAGKFWEKGKQNTVDFKDDKALDEYAKKLEEQDKSDDKGRQATNYWDRQLFGNEDITAYQNREKGLEEAWKGSGAAAKPLAVLATGANIGLDLPISLGLDDIAKSLGKGVIKEVAESSAPEQIAKLIAKKVPPELLDDAVSKLVDATDPRQVTKVLKGVSKEAKSLRKRADEVLPPLDEILQKGKQTAGNVVDDLVGAADVSSNNTLRRPGAVIQKQIEDLVNSGDDAGAQKVIDAITDPNLKRGMQSFLESTGRNTGEAATKVVVDPVTKKITRVPIEEQADSMVKSIIPKKFTPGLLDDAGNPTVAVQNTATGQWARVTKDQLATLVDETGNIRKFSADDPLHVSQLKRLADPKYNKTLTEVPFDELASKSPALRDAISGGSGALPPSSVDGFINKVAPGPGERQFGLLKTTQETPQLTDATKGAIGEINPQTYGQMNIQDTIDAATKKLGENFDEVKNKVFKGFDEGRWDSDTSAHAIALLRDANKRGDTQLAKEIMEKAAPLGKASGQANVLWRTMVDSNTPEGMVKFAQNIIDNANKNMGFLTKTFRKGEKFSLDEEATNFIKNTAAKAQQLPDGPEKDALTKEIMQRINDAIPPGASEMFDAYRYQNMLSGPRTQARNTAGNVFQAGVTRPLTKLTQGSVDWIKSGLFGKERQAYVKEVPDYYKGMLNGFGDAVEQFKAGWAGDIQQPDLQNVKAYQQNKMPKALTFVTRAMEGSDRFFQSLISSGEYAAQKAKGATDEVARKEAERISKYSVFRAATDPKNATGQGALLSQIDKVTNLAQQIGKDHKVFRWFVPFVQTPMNITKQMIELSPAGFATLYKSKGVAREEQMSKAILGSAVTSIGAMMAMQGNTTWAPPTDKAEREAFYSSGKKPYSVKIGDTWVPMITFGPFAYALGIPAAVKDANDRGDYDDSAFEKLGNIVAGQANFFTQQTYLQGMANFINTITGQEDATAGGSLGFTLGQTIPLQGLSRYVNGILDPVLRKKKTVADTVASDLPIVGAQYGKDNLEANTNVFTGEDSKRNASDYLAPYSMGKEASNPDDAEFQKGVGEFYKIKAKVNSKKTDAQEYITQALEEGNYTEAQNAALDYNDWVAEQFAPWNESYGQYVSDDIQEAYNGLKISTQGLKTRRKNLLDKSQNGTINYR